MPYVARWVASLLVNEEREGLPLFIWSRSAALSISCVRFVSHQKLADFQESDAVSKNVAVFARSRLQS